MRLYVSGGGRVWGVSAVYAVQTNRVLLRSCTSVYCICTSHGYRFLSREGPAPADCLVFCVLSALFFTTILPDVVRRFCFVGQTSRIFQFVNRVRRRFRLSCYKLKLSILISLLNIKPPLIFPDKRFCRCRVDAWVCCHYWTDLNVCGCDRFPKLVCRFLINIKFRLNETERGGSRTNKPTSIAYGVGSFYRLSEFRLIQQYDIS